VWSECAHGLRAAILRAVGARVILDFGVGAAFTFAPPARATPYRALESNSVATEPTCVIFMSLPCLVCRALRDRHVPTVLSLNTLTHGRSPDHTRAAVA
jgi:hypothetical protein